MNYNELITVENLFQAYYEFRKGKRKRVDIQIFERNLEDNLFSLYLSLKNNTYRHGVYEEFYVNDPKRRHIHKASASDRIVHHLLYKYLYDVFDKTFIYDSYSCRLDKGTHRGVKRLEKFARIVSRNYSRNCYGLKFDVKKFFANVDYEILFGLLKNKITDRDILTLLFGLIESFHSEDLASQDRKGIPLGNLTSQIFANIYMNQHDQFIKHKLKIKYYIRYADDFVILSTDKEYLSQCIDTSQQFLFDNLKLELHPQKIIISKFTWGINFLGYIVLPHYILPRTQTIRRMFRKIENKLEDYKSNEISEFSLNQTIQSYRGYLSHSNSYKFSQEVRDMYEISRILKLINL